MPEISAPASRICRRRSMASACAFSSSSQRNPFFPAVFPFTSRSRISRTWSTSLNSDILSFRRESFPWKYSANEVTNSVFPTPVGPTNRNAPFTSVGSVKPSSLRPRCLSKAGITSGCPRTRPFSHSLNPLTLSTVTTACSLFGGFLLTNHTHKVERRLGFLDQGPHQKPHGHPIHPELDALVDPFTQSDADLMAQDDRKRALARRALLAVRFPAVNQAQL